jgi:hypothetical protein
VEMDHFLRPKPSPPTPISGPNYDLAVAPPQSDTLIPLFGFNYTTYSLVLRHGICQFTTNNNLI